MKQLPIPNLSEDDFLLDRLEEQIHRFEQLLGTRFHGKEDAVQEKGFSDDALSSASRGLFADGKASYRKERQ
ncbi:hypothetical protein [Kistimonas asteriae]|uniref:hypothetical protein n=1 Tax=Kistimonas asteriae TaxID=517724 RepID=UPI001BA4A0F8|nr:hypothetical protein [Kistimonas asteriae]